VKEMVKELKESGIEVYGYDTLLRRRRKIIYRIFLLGVGASLGNIE